MGFKTTKYVLQARAGNIVNKEIELTEEELKFLHEESLNLANKIRKVL